MADGMTTEESTELVAPASLAMARANVAAHPFSGSTALVRFEERAAPYAEQMATTGLGFTADDGARRLWTVSKVPLSGPDGRPWPGVFGLQRDDNGARFGSVGRIYKPLQSEDAAKAFDLAFGHIPAAFRPKITNAGALGARVFAQMALPAEISHLLRVDSDKDSPVTAFLTYTNSHEGTGTAVVGPSVTRIWCRNTWTSAHVEGKRKGGLSLRHTVGNVNQYREHVSAWYRATAQSYAAQGQKLNAYAAHKMSPAAVKAVAAEVLIGEIVEEEQRTKAQAANIDAIIEMIEKRDGQFVPRGEVTAYSLLQAVTAYEMHNRPARGELAEQNETRLWRVLTDDEVIPRAFAVLDRTTKKT